MPPLIERRRISITPLQMSSPMAESKEPCKENPTKKNPQKQAQKKPASSPMAGFRSLFSCKYHETAVHEAVVKKMMKKKKKKREKRTGWSGSLCNLRESSRVTQRPEPAVSSSPEIGSSSSSRSLIKGTAATSSSSSSFSSSASSSSSSSSSLGGSFRGMHFRRLSGCYECHMVVDPVTGVSSRAPSLRRCSVFPCPDCGEIFNKSESLELHQAVKHAVSELGLEDNSRNIVEIIFKSSWLKKQAPLCNIERVLKVHHTQKTITKFEAYRDSIKSKANKLAKKHPRCIADGNELLRFHCTTTGCSLGLDGSTGLCGSPDCGVCGVIKEGFKPDECGRIRTMATSGRAHDAAAGGGKERAMLVCRVVAGRVRRSEEGGEECDSVAGSTAGVYSNLDELSVFDPKALLPCFVVIYKSL